MEELLRIAWRTVGAIVTRVVDDAHVAHDPLDGLMRIGIDEVSYKKGHRYLIVIVNHDTGALVWAAPGRDKKTLNGCFDALGKSRCARLREVSADGAEWISEVVGSRCLNAKLVMDAFHIVKWATDALDEVRREVWNHARREAGDQGLASQLQGLSVRAVEEPRASERPPTGQAGVGSHPQQQPVPGLPAKTGAAPGRPAQGRGGHRPAGPLAGLGQPVSHRGVRRTGPQDPSPSHCHRARIAIGNLQRPGRVDQHQDPGPSPGSLSASARPRPSSPWPCSPWADAAPSSQVGAGSSSRRPRPPTEHVNRERQPRTSTANVNGERQRRGDGAKNKGCENTQPPAPQRGAIPLESIIADNNDRAVKRLRREGRPYGPTPTLTTVRLTALVDGVGNLVGAVPRATSQASTESPGTTLIAIHDSHPGNDPRKRQKTHNMTMWPDRDFHSAQSVTCGVQAHELFGNVARRLSEVVETVSSGRSVVHGRGRGVG